MSKISVIGPGAMETARAQAFVKADHGLTLWKRALSKIQPPRSLSANEAESVADALQASPIIVDCIDSRAATIRLPRTDDVVLHLSDRTQCNRCG